MSGIISGIIGLMNNFVVFFLNTYTDKNIIEQWNSKENQSAFVKMITDFISKESKDDKKPRSSKKSKNPKDENKPKKPLTAFFIFLSDKRGEIKAENPELSVAQISKVVSERWKLLSDDEKAIYDEKANNDKIRYETEMANYVPSTEIETESSKTKKIKKIKDKDAPKGVKTAYMFYASDNRASVKESNPDMKGPAISKQLGLNWKSESDEIKNKYKQLEEEDKIRFNNEISEYKGAGNEEVESEPEPKTKNTKKTSKKAKEDKEVKDKTKKVEPTSGNKKKAFIKFCKEKRKSVKEDNKDKGVKEITHILSKMWLELDESSQKEYYDDEE